MYVEMEFIARDRQASLLREAAEMRLQRLAEGRPRGTFRPNRHHHSAPRPRK